MSVEADFAVERFRKRENQLKYRCLSQRQRRPPPPVPHLPALPPQVLIFFS